MNNSNIEQLMIESDESILSALKKMNIIHRKLLIVVKDGLFHSLVSIGDIQRAIIADVDLHNPVKNILRSKVNVAAVGDNKHKVNCIIELDDTYVGTATQGKAQKALRLLIPYPK